MVYKSFDFELSFSVFAINIDISQLMSVILFSLLLSNVFLGECGDFENVVVIYIWIILKILPKYYSSFSVKYFLWQFSIHFVLDDYLKRYVELFKYFTLVILVFFKFSIEPSGNKLDLT